MAICTCNGLNKNCVYCGGSGVADAKELPPKGDSWDRVLRNERIPPPRGDGTGKASIQRGKEKAAREEANRLRRAEEYERDRDEKAAYRDRFRRQFANERLIISRWREDFAPEPTDECPHCGRAIPVSMRFTHACMEHPESVAERVGSFGLVFCEYCWETMAYGDLEQHARFACPDITYRAARHLFRR